MMEEPTYSYELNYYYDSLFNGSYPNYTFPLDPFISVPEIQPLQIATLVFYGLVFLLGVPGNALVVWVTGFCMQRTVTSIWFLNLALADLLCCLSLPLLMVPLAHDDHWHFGPLACTLVKSLFHLLMLCSILQLVLISVDRWLMVSRPVWCQNNRRPRLGALGCVLVWCLALLGVAPQFVYTRELHLGEKRECVAQHTVLSGWLTTVSRFLLGFVFPSLVIAVCHWLVYRKAVAGGGSGQVSSGSRRSNKTRRVIAGVILSFFLCWLPLHVMDFLFLVTPLKSPNRPTVYLVHTLALCLAYFNSCLNPLLYVCLGRGFKDSMSRSLRNLLPFVSEEPLARASITNNDTRTTSSGKEMTKV